jgi:hypothetical protein
MGAKQGNGALAAICQQYSVAAAAQDLEADRSHRGLVFHYEDRLASASRVLSGRRNDLGLARVGDFRQQDLDRRSPAQLGSQSHISTRLNDEAFDH